MDTCLDSIAVGFECLDSIAAGFERENFNNLRDKLIQDGEISTPDNARMIFVMSSILNYN